MKIQYMQYARLPHFQENIETKTLSDRWLADICVCMCVFLFFFLMRSTQLFISSQFSARTLFSFYFSPYMNKSNG